MAFSFLISKSFAFPLVFLLQPGIHKRWKLGGGDKRSAVKWLEERLPPNLTAALYKVLPFILPAMASSELFLFIGGRNRY